MDWMIKPCLKVMLQCIKRRGSLVAFHGRSLSVSCDEKWSSGFRNTDDGPSGWAQPKDKQKVWYHKRKYQRDLQEEAVLYDELKNAIGVTLPKYKDEITKATLKDLATANNVPLTVTASKLDYGWIWKAKGMLQVLWEDESRSKDYRLVARDPDDDTCPWHCSSWRAAMTSKMKSVSSKPSPLCIELKRRWRQSIIKRLLGVASNILGVPQNWGTGRSPWKKRGKKAILKKLWAIASAQ